MTDALKPCPFCGTQSVNDFDKWAVVRNIAHFVRCPECHSRTGNWGAHESALAAWNRRASPPDLEGVREALTAAIRAANLALFVIRKQGVMPNSSWEAGFNSDLKQAESALAALSSLPNSPGGVGERKLLSAAKLLYANCLSCVQFHHGHDVDGNGLPGWLADAERDIKAAEAALATAPTAEGK